MQCYANANANATLRYVMLRYAMLYAHIEIVVTFLVVKIFNCLAVFRNPVVGFGRTLVKMNAGSLPHLSKQPRTLSLEQKFEKNS